jgi:alpha-tubulin suppressor-like RCC1 family protein
MSLGWKSLSVDRQHTLAVREDGSLWGWGSNRAGQLADDSVTLNVTQIDSMSDW